MIPHKLLLISLFFLLINSEMRAQCSTDFKVQAEDTDAVKTGRIEIDVIKGEFSQSYNIKVYQINAEVELVREITQRANNNKLIINGLGVNTYWVRIEWGNACYKTIGGLEGIKVGTNAEGR